MWFLILGLVSFCLAANNTGLDPVDNFCRIWYHQSVVKNNALYIDGGLEVFTPSSNASASNKTTGYNTYLVKLDLTDSWDWKTNISLETIEKTKSSQTGTAAPLLVRGALYSGPTNDSQFYLYGGSVSTQNTSFPGWQSPSSPQYSLWSYDTSNQDWSQYDTSLDVPNRPNNGAFAEAPDLGLAFYHNGQIDEGSSPALEKESSFRAFLPGLVVIDTKTQIVRNYSTDAVPDSPRSRHGGVYIAGVGEKGIFVTVGGVTKSVDDSSSKNKGSLISMEYIDILDVSSLSTSNGTWYRQKASGDIPSSRLDFCLVAVSAADNSSHNIYMYGGRDFSTDYDELYILSLPSFKWIKVWQGESPRWGHTCHVVGKSQLLTVGGADDGNFTRGCDWETKMVGVYDLSRGTWGSVYKSYDDAYQVPRTVFREVGGDATGGATTTQPDGGFDSKDTAQLFGSSGTSSSKGISGGAIAGAVIGSVAGAAILAGLAFFFFRRKKTIPAQQTQLSDEDKKADGKPRHYPIFESPGSNPAVELGENNVRHEMDPSPKASRFMELP
ncbi:hypothetical protein ASPWEDRAFT_122305 [Aspergillus wentii DTO 134E9]|uniref:Kelch repeat protein n=1 Tax=Aspergillus wentii DTO 134E9 TaxID=1073089 RepID=A0A1L9R465_ASPWE|nr:uncharacterized protein ASPWEDRAFT_122305 [Aspergillus wentii DTO 134E9]OJJ29700.1 hypothetical protein ASPWEDRAFT_122305 [Aspergillus wentii DTO 134E9]